jgi:hypothetical protein
MTWMLSVMLHIILLSFYGASAPLVEPAHSQILVAALGVPVWLALSAKALLGWLLVTALSVPVWIVVLPSQGWSRWRSALTSRSILPCQ